MVPRKLRPLVKIGQLEQVLHVPKSTLNYYITCELIKAADRSPSGQRLFDLDEVRSVLEEVDSLKKQGKSIDEIRRVFNHSRVK